MADLSGEIVYGGGTAAEQARRLWMDRMYDEVVEEARKNSVNVAPPEVDLLISPSGFSPETTLLAYELVQPTRLVVICLENGTRRCARATTRAWTRSARTSEP